LAHFAAYLLSAGFPLTSSLSPGTTTF